VVIAFYCPVWWPAFTIASGRLAVFWLGIAMLAGGSLLRHHCFRMLGASFRPVVDVKTDQAVVDRGAYRYLRHPSYSGAILMFLMVKHRSELAVTVSGFFKFRLAELWRVGRMGLPGAAEWISWQSSQLLITGLIAGLGTTTIAARGITSQTESFTYLPAQGLATAASILVGQQMGARQREGAVATARRSMIYGVAAMVGLGVVLFIFPTFFAGIFTSDPGVLQITKVTLRVAALYKAGQALNIICGGIYRGAGNPEWPTILTTIGTWSLSVPLAFLMVHLGYGLAGVLVAQVVDETVRGAINVWYFTTPRWRFRHV
jgi:Na+-driven multidrug efflux pump